MVRTQVSLTDEQSKRLKRIAARRGVPVAQVIRQSIDITLASEDTSNQSELRARARATFGRFCDEATDVSENHDKYLAGTYQE